jgi:hypothetical protein
MIDFADFGRVGFNEHGHFLSGRLGIDPRLFGEEGVLLLGVKGQRLDIRRHDGWRSASTRRELSATIVSWNCPAALSIWSRAGASEFTR